jgi:hypothetical protein
LRKIPFAKLLLFLGLVAVAGQAAAEKEVFRWVDDDGVVHYSDRPTDPRARSTGVTFSATDPGRIREQELRKWEQERQADADASDEEQQRPAEEAMAANLKAQEERVRQLECNAARERFATYTTAPRLYESLPGGERRYLTEEELTAARTQAEKDVETWCN